MGHLRQPAAPRRLPRYDGRCGDDAEEREVAGSGRQDNGRQEGPHADQRIIARPCPALDILCELSDVACVAQGRFWKVQFGANGRRQYWTHWAWRLGISL